MDSSYGDIITRLGKVSQRYLTIGIAESLLATVAVFIFLFILFGVSEAFSYHSSKVKTILFWFATIASVLTGTVIFFIRFIRRPETEEISRMVEQAFPQFKDKLISAVQLGNLDEESLRGQSPDLVRALVVRASKELGSIKAERSVSTKHLISLVRISYSAAIFFLLLSVLSPGLLAGGFFRFADYRQTYLPPGNMTIFTLVRDGSIIRGENFNNSGFFSSKTAPLKLFWRWKDSDAWNTRSVKVDDNTGYFALTIEKPRLSFSYYLESGSSYTPHYGVNVIERPVVENIEMSLLYPAYTGMGAVTRKDNDGNIRALRGTKVNLAVRANKLLRSMTIQWSDSTSSSCTVNGSSGVASFTITKNLDYTISLLDTLGIGDINPILYRITCLEDEKPVVTILSPKTDTILSRNMTLPIVYHAEDDYGISKISLQYKLPFEENTRTVSIKKGWLPRQSEDGYVWNLSDLNLLPQDQVTFYLSVWDNDVVRGPKRGDSEKYTVKVPSLTDILKETAEEQKSGMERIRDAQEAGKQKDKALDEVRRNILKGNKTDWNDRNAIEESKKQLERMQEGVKDFSDSVKKMADKLSDEDMATLETVEKLRKISEMMDKIADGDMKEALKKLTQASMEIDQRAVKSALDQYKITADTIKKKLDAIIQLLEQVKAIQRFETAKKVLEDIALKQAELSQKLQNSPIDPSLSREQKSLAQEMDKLEKELKDITGELKEKFSLNTKSFEDYLESTDISEGMQETAGNIEKGMNDKARKGMNSSNTQLAEMLKNMDKLENLMKSANTRDLKNRILAAMLELLAVSKNQEKLLENDEGYTPESLTRRELEVMEGFEKAGKTLSALGAVSPELAGVIEQITSSVNTAMKNSVDSFAAGNIPMGELNGRHSLSMVNNTVLFLSNLLKNSGNNQGKGMPGDLMQELQMIADGQLSLQMRMGDDSSELMKQLAAEQQKLADMLSQLGKKISEDKRLREMLDKLTGDMDDTARMMRKNEKRELVERKQLDIYRRLLDARRSKREKDEETPERKSWTANRNESIGADRLAGDLGEKQAELNERMKKALQDDIDPKFKKLIQLYFESMIKISPGTK